MPADSDSLSSDSQPPVDDPSLPLCWRSVVRRPEVRTIGLFVGVYLLIATVAAAVRGNSEFVFYIGVMVLLAAAVLEVHRRVLLSPALLWCLAAWGLMHMAGGLMPVPEGWPINGDQRVLYSLWLVPKSLKYDHITHAFGFGVTTLLCWEGLRRLLADHAGVAIEQVRPTFGRLVLCAAAGMGFGALNEVVEFAATLLMPSTNVGGYINTGWDLVANLVGCAAAAAAIAWRGRAGTP